MVLVTANENIKQVILCADDYGQTPEIGQAIRELASQGRISAISCLVTSSAWQQEAQLLKPLLEKCDIGLHFNLTEGQPLSHTSCFSPLHELLFKTLLRRMNIDTIRAEFEAQLAAFIKAIGKVPDYIDGHQHIQHLPQIREAILQVYQTQLQNTNTYIRSLYEPCIHTIHKKSAAWKIAIMQLTGAITFKKLLQANNIPHNMRFGGIYHFQNAKQFAAIFPQFLQQATSNTLIVCHPGCHYLTPNIQDPLKDSRYHELAYLQSPQFIEDCQRYHIRVVRFQDMK